jgi:molecular chaperone GrpE (heat shock protein)
MTQDTNQEQTEQEVLTNEETVPLSDASVPATQEDEILRLKEALARSQADYQNLLMRVDRDKVDMIHFLSAKILSPLLTQIDNLERAVKLKE